jgi:hypothetical protein
MLREIHRLTTFQHHNLLLCHTYKIPACSSVSFPLYFTQIRMQKKKHNFKKITETRPRFSLQTAASSSHLFKLPAATVVSLDLDLLLKGELKRAAKMTHENARITYASTSSGFYTIVSEFRVS